MVHDYRFETIDSSAGGAERYIEEARAYLRRADELGLGIFLGLPRAAVRAGDNATLTRIINELANERALWMWYIYDEPRPDVVTVDAASSAYTLLRRLDPQRPSIMLTNREHMPQYHAFCDVLWVDRYPITATSLGRASLSPVAETLKAAMQTVSQGKSVWPVLQAFDNKGNPSLRKRVAKLPMPDDRTHRPNEVEIRAQAHIAIAQGVMGVAYYWAPEAWYSMKTTTPGIWRSLTRVLGELRSLEPVLLSGEAPRPVNLSDGDEKTMTWARLYDGRQYVGVVNADIHKPANVMLEGLGTGTSFEKVLGDGAIKGTDRGLGIRLGPAGVVVLATAPR